MVNNDKYIYVIELGNLKSFLKGSESMLWSGRPKGIDVIDFVKIPKSDDCVVLLDWTRSSLLQINNVFRLTPFGEIIWEIFLPDKYKNVFGINRDYDAYTRIYEISESFVSINSMSGFLDKVNANTGEVVDSAFVK